MQVLTPQTAEQGRRQRLPRHLDRGGVADVVAAVPPVGQDGHMGGDLLAGRRRGYIAGDERIKRQSVWRRCQLAWPASRIPGQSRHCRQLALNGYSLRGAAAARIRY